MRTTLTLEPDVARLIEEEAARTRKSMKDVVNEGLRRGLGPRGPIRRSSPFRVRPHRTKLRPGFDFESYNQLAD
jgi:hypothetical protein